MSILLRNPNKAQVLLLQEQSQDLRALLQPTQASANWKEERRTEEMSSRRLFLFQSSPSEHGDRGDDPELRVGGQLQVLP